jgi:hypothetical protein
MLPELSPAWNAGSAAQEPRSDDDVGTFLDDWGSKEGYLGCVVLRVRIERHHDIGFELSRSGEAGVDGCALSTVGFEPYHFCTGC